VDTNVLSESAKRKPDAGVMAWLRENERELYVSTITIGELRRGIERIPESARKTKLRHWLQSLCDCMQGRVLSFSTSSAHVWGQLKAKWDGAGVVVPTLDSQIGDRPGGWLCDPGHAVQPHAVWHVLSAVALLLYVQLVDRPE
jgi:predicted nucleic acid-binding protein